MRSPLALVALAPTALLLGSLPAQGIAVTATPLGDVNPGQTVSVDVEVTLDAGLATRADVYILADSTNSMGPALANVQANVTTVVNTLLNSGVDLAIGVGNYKDFPLDPYCFQHQLSPTTDETAIVDAINQWSATGGSDRPEGWFFALNELASDPTIGFRPDPDVKRVIVIFGDAPSHEPICPAIAPSQVLSTINEASVIAALGAAGVGGTAVIGISTPTGFAVTALDDDPTLWAFDYRAFCPIGGIAGQASRIGAASGGTHLHIGASSLLSQTILNTIAEATGDRSVSLEVAGDPGLSNFGFTVTPPAQDVTLPTTPGTTVTARFQLDVEGLLCVADGAALGARLRVLLDGARTAVHAPLQITQSACANVGTGCVGANGTPTLRQTGYATVGRELKIALADAAPSSPAWLLLGQEASLPLAAIGATGCTLYAWPAAMLPKSTSASGDAAVALPLADPALLGQTLTSQWAILDAAAAGGLALSNGGKSGIGRGAGAIAITASPSNAALGDLVTIRGVNFGTNPADLRIRATDDQGGTTAFRPVRLSVDPTTGDEVLEAVVEAVPATSSAATLSIARGLGGQAGVRGTPGLTAPAFSVVWNGPTPATAQTAATSFTPLASVADAHAAFRVVDDLLVADLPPSPCGGSDYPPGTSLTVNLHWQTTCANQRFAHEHDAVVKTVIVTGTAVNAAQLATEYAVQLQEAFDQRYGAGAITVRPRNAGGTFGFALEVSDPGCSIVRGGGSLGLTCP
ncbi:MAG: hypothetical protein AAF628_22460 [Planctomycetota bacterium]